MIHKNHVQKVYFFPPYYEEEEIKLREENVTLFDGCICSVAVMYPYCCMSTVLDRLLAAIRRNNKKCLEGILRLMMNL